MKSTQAEAATQETHCSCTRHVPRRVPRSMPMHDRVVMKSTTYHFSYATSLVTPCSRGVWTQETHCSCTRHVPRRVPCPCPCTTGVMKSRTDHLFAVTHAAEAATQETHCSCTRHVPRRVPRPCPCTTGVMKSTTDHLSSNHACSRGDDTGDTLQLHKARTKARASSMPVHNKCNEIKNRSFICSHACSRGGNTGGTLQLH